jgi:Putative adhesin
MATDPPTRTQFQPPEYQQPGYQQPGYQQPQGPPPTPRMPNPSTAVVLRLVGVVLVLGLIAVGAASVVVQFFTQEAVETLPLTTGVTRVIATSDTGDVRVRAAVGVETPRLTSTLRWSFDRPQVQRDVTGDTEQLDARCPRRWFASNCSVDLELVLPADTVLKIDTDTGDIRISGTTADLEATTATGDVRVSAVSGANITARTNTGDVTVLAGRQDGTVQADSDTGDVRLTLTAAPRAVHAKTSTGDVTITVPPGAGYAVSSGTDVGERTVSVPTDPAAERSINAESSVGDVRVLTAGQ